METSLHRSLKALYADGPEAVEVPWGRYRIDVVRQGELIEVQHASLASIRDKIAALLADHPVRVVKPIVVAKQIVNRASADGPVCSRRKSPKRGRLLDLFHDLVHFTRVFPHPRLALDVVLVDIEEDRYPGHGRRRRWRKNDFVVADQRLAKVHQTLEFRTGDDLRRLLPDHLPAVFDTAELARALDCPRWIAQRVAYCLRHAGALAEAGKRRNARLYHHPAHDSPAPARRRRR